MRLSYSSICTGIYVRKTDTFSKFEKLPRRQGEILHRQLKKITSLIEQQHGFSALINNLALVLDCILVFFEISFQAHVPHVPGPPLRPGPPRGVHAGDGLCPGGRQEVQVRLPHLQLGGGGEGGPELAAEVRA